MRIYCLCQITGDIPKQARDPQGFGPIDNQVFGAPNRLGPVESPDEKYRPVILKKPMRIVQKGVPQRKTIRGVHNRWVKNREEAHKFRKTFKEAKRCYPDVFIFECPVCHARVCVEMIT